MQSGNREYFGRNEYWTPSTIGLTQSLIDTSINKIELKDNSSGESNLFKIENNKLKSTIPLICDDPTANEEVSNKKYVDNKSSAINTNLNNQINAINTNLNDQINEINSNLNNQISEINTNLTMNYYNKDDIDTNYYNKNDIDTNHYNKSFINGQLYTINNKLNNVSPKSFIYHRYGPLDGDIYNITNIPKFNNEDISSDFTAFNISFTTNMESSSNINFVTPEFYIYCTNQSYIPAMKDLVCTLTITSYRALEGKCNKPFYLGLMTSENGDRYYAKYKFTEIMDYNATLYLNFFFEKDKTYPPDTSFVLDGYELNVHLNSYL